MNSYNRWEAEQDAILQREEDAIARERFSEVER